MKAPIWIHALRLARENRELRRINAELGQALALANRTAEKAMGTARAWKARAELLYVNAGPSIEPWLKQLSEIENLEERK